MQTLSFWKANFLLAGDESISFYKNLNVNYNTQKSLLPILILSQLNPAHILYPVFLKTDFNVFQFGLQPLIETYQCKIHKYHSNNTQREKR